MYNNSSESNYANAKSLNLFLIYFWCRLSEQLAQDLHIKQNGPSPLISENNYMHLDFTVVCKQQRCRPACASTQSDLHLCYSLSGKDNTFTVCMQNFQDLS